MEKHARIEELVAFLNKCCDEYYNKNNPTLSDAEYDALFDELSLLEKETGYVLPDSPTVRPGYEVLSELNKVAHDIPLLSLAKTKSAADVYNMAVQSDGYLALIWMNLQDIMLSEIIQMQKTNIACFHSQENTE